LTFRN